MRTWTDAASHTRALLLTEAADKLPHWTPAPLCSCHTPVGVGCPHRLGTWALHRSWAIASASELFCSLPSGLLASRLSLSSPSSNTTPHPRQAHPDKPNAHLTTFFRVPSVPHPEGILESKAGLAHSEKKKEKENKADRPTRRGQSAGHGHSLCGSVGLRPTRPQVPTTSQRPRCTGRP